MQRVLVTLHGFVCVCLCERVCCFTSRTAVAAAATNRLCVCVCALIRKNCEAFCHTLLCVVLWIERISVGKDLLVLASSCEHTLSTSPAVSIEESKRDPAVLARCSIDLPVLLFVHMQKLYPWCCQNSQASSFGKLSSFNFIYLFFCPVGREDGSNSWKDWWKNGVAALTFTKIVSYCVGVFAGLNKWVYAVPVCLVVKRISLHMKPCLLAVFSVTFLV